MYKRAGVAIIAILVIYKLYGNKIKHNMVYNEIINEFDEDKLDEIINKKYVPTDEELEEICNAYKTRTIGRDINKDLIRG
jgi:hypothetical protein